ncbi:hypothetical protein [Streptomyces sp. V4I2]|uniref:hypothetical protein n=1 Tax=Streptomyces sp. V4I2 TaxID=3042280 RepID=UPI0027860DDD|nr:hypothetical protein [Streptomyces sp. V4I2]MDQ1048975.1 hypothetical protein [Streptomyces sp. V4I2]
MPYAPPPRTPSGPRRRTLLASAAGAVLLVGCSTGSEDSDGGTTGGSPSVVERARARAAGESTDLVARYDAVIAVHPALAQRLGPLRSEAVRHAEAFGGLRKASPSESLSVSPSDAASPRPASAAPSPAVPADEQAALAELAAAERSLADRRAKALLDLPGEPARLLASVAAAGAAHAYLLTEGAK